MTSSHMNLILASITRRVRRCMLRSMLSSSEVPPSLKVARGRPYLSFRSMRSAACSFHGHRDGLEGIQQDDGVDEMTQGCGRAGLQACERATLIASPYAIGNRGVEPSHPIPLFGVMLPMPLCRSHQCGRVHPTNLGMVDAHSCVEGDGRTSQIKNR